ncbi:unnamed protein product [Heligmosomoides polygyrus]|uniref:PDDEXK_5 domain-containing protein n=1 Tax=Heligmosomoides polygyrus TaxID=6339 RepID=A0A183FJY0_HELPZ|nr:unnamed protein product [Heligmosomoides polygyrus]
MDGVVGPRKSETRIWNWVYETAGTCSDCPITRAVYEFRIKHARFFNDRLMKIVVAAKERLYHFFSAYAPQSDLNGHVGAAKDGYSCHGGFGYGSRNPDGERILEYAESHSLTIVNTVFRKRDSHLISYYSGCSKSQIDFVLVKDRDRSIVTDAKIVPYETVAPQHRPLVCTFKITPPRVRQVERCGAARIKWWRMKEKEAAVISRVRLPTVTTTDDVKAKVREKKSLYHVFLGDKTAVNWQKYQKAKKAAKKAVTVAKATHHSEVNEKHTSRDGGRYFYRLAKTRHRHTEDIEKIFGINDES